MTIQNKNENLTETNINEHMNMEDLYNIYSTKNEEEAIILIDPCAVVPCNEKLKLLLKHWNKKHEFISM